ncbi:uncharacterized protein LOC129765665 [Toxorhynchites rutilus septentrionalis]|uniref:uncharacterized protein LOC129765665 n=1 Tax=Toxorhynchites rutilus septentrionalis TaxID=329112 RepID=UPI00247B1AFD|nr:uncharacterized protein LOC129765665 [Toxorhynchites rutilus septentrionalis]
MSSASKNVDQKKKKGKTPMLSQACATSACVGCSQPESAEDMVQCDSCDAWWHYTCAKVDASIKDKTWRCIKCEDKCNRSKSGKSDTSSARKVRVQLELQRLEEEKALADKMHREKEEQEKVSREEKKAIEEDYVRRKYQLLGETVVDDDKSERSRTSAQSSRSKVKEWIDRQSQVLNTGSGNKLTPTATSTANPTIIKEFVSTNISTGAIRKSKVVSLNEKHGITNSGNKVIPSLTQEKTVNWGAGIEAIESQHVHQVQYVHNEPTFNNNYMQNSGPVHDNSMCESIMFPRQEGNQQAYVIPDQIENNAGPTSRQLSARHVIPKELPIFAGNPIDWPMFISAYKNSTSMCGFSDGENLMRLQRCLKGNALEAVRSHLLMPESVPIVLSTLTTLYGRPELIVQVLLAKVKSIPAPKADKLETLVSFGLVVQNLCAHLKAAQQEAQLNNPSLLHELVNKLPASIKLDWALYKRNCSVTNLGTFGEYMSTLATAASDVTYPEVWDTPKQIYPEKHKPRNFINTHSDDSTERERNAYKTFKIQATDKMNSCLICDKPGHKAKQCWELKRMSVDDRWKTVARHKLCKRCIIPHGKWPCRATYLCGIDGCEARHHQLLHPGKSESVGAHQHIQHSALFKVIPITLHNGKVSIETFAFLDDGSSVTLLEARIAKKLNINGDADPLCLKWTANVSRNEANSQRVNVEISGANNGPRHTLTNVRTVETLQLPSQSLNYEKMVEHFPYLSGLPVKSYESAIPRILIGLDNLKLTLALKSRERRSNEPVATKTRLGWTIYGKIGSNATTHTSLHICECSGDDTLHKLVEDFIKMENLAADSTFKPESESDQRALQILQATTTRLNNGRFETGLLWKHDTVKFPNSYPMAVRRLECLERKLKLLPEIKKNLQNQIIDYQLKGYAHKADRIELNRSDPERIWYLPIGFVLNSRKPGKVRVIWDAAAKVNGISLNSMLLKGPDLLTPLPAVLSQYRQRQYAITGDIREMFHRIFIRAADRQSQRFLWRENENEEPDTYIMDVATFGSTCSPCAAQYVKNINGKEYEKEYPDAAAAIINNHYVDDFLYSSDTEAELIELALDVKTVHAKAGFEIRNWMSNSKHVLTRVGDQNSDKCKIFSFNESGGSERVLGIKWLPEHDAFSFNIEFQSELQPIASGEIVPTKRQVLNIVMSLFDPLGIISAFSIHGKILIQEIWRTGIGWDNTLPNEIVDKWYQWIAVIGKLRAVTIPRCYFPNYEKESYDTLQLHIFVDASESAYCAVAYFRIMDRGNPRCALVSSKAKVAPLKQLSVPRLELQAAVLGTRMAKAIAENHTLRIKKRFMWTDSTTVLDWLRSDSRKYRQYVAFRIGEILSKSSIEEWRWVPTKLNVADEATKWGKGPSFDSKSRWYKGPDFLFSNEDHWPQRERSATDTNEELRTSYIHHTSEKVPLIDFHRFSKWERLVRSIAYVHHFINITCSGWKSATPLSSEQFRQAESTLWKQAQQFEYYEELQTLQKNRQQEAPNKKSVDRTSPLAKPSPFIDEQGVLRMETRLVYAQCITYDAKCPIVLPRHHPVTRLLIDWFHRKFLHSNGETIVNDIRQKFHISQLRTAVKKISNECAWCRVYKAAPQTPRMAPLPLERLSPYVRPFTYLGIDYCGPFLVKIGRSQVKRWIALFTCLTVRAVHLEIAHSLSTESCKMTIRRFIARRGSPLDIFTDNGTNFVGANKDLVRQISGLNVEMAATFTNANTKWHFNPPSAPHMGGSWERLVRSVKTSLSTLCFRKTLDDESFLTFIAEAESIINCRPLTYVPLDNEDQESITPNHFLMLSSKGVVQPMQETSDMKTNLMANWKIIQHLLDQFWSRWIKEYLPTITRRTKWLADTKPLELNDLVMIVDESKRNSWVRGKVVKTLAGRDGRIRQADVQTMKGMMRRPVSKLAVLDVLNCGKAE